MRRSGCDGRRLDKRDSPQNAHFNDAAGIAASRLRDAKREIRRKSDIGEEHRNGGVDESAGVSLTQVAQRNGGLLIPEDVPQRAHRVLMHGGTDDGASFGGKNPLQESIVGRRGFSDIIQQNNIRFRFERPPEHSAKRNTGRLHAFERKPSAIFKKNACNGCSNWT